MTDSIIYINFVNYEKNFYLNIVKNIQHYNRLNNFLYLIPGKYEYMFFINGINIFFNNNKARIIKNYFVTFSFFDLSVNFYIICNNNILSKISIENILLIQIKNIIIMFLEKEKLILMKIYH